MNRVSAIVIAENVNNWRAQSNDFSLEMKDTVKEHEEYLTTGQLPSRIQAKSRSSGGKDGLGRHGSMNKKN